MVREVNFAVNIADSTQRYFSESSWELIESQRKDFGIRSEFIFPVLEALLGVFECHVALNAPS